MEKKLCPNLVVVEKWGLPLNKSNEELNRIAGIVTGEYSVVSPTVLTLTLWVSWKTQNQVRRDKIKLVC